MECFAAVLYVCVYIVYLVAGASNVDGFVCGRHDLGVGNSYCFDSFNVL